MDEVITFLEEQIKEGLSPDTPGQVDAVKFAALCSSFKDLIQARLLEDLRTGRLEVVKDIGKGWLLRERS